MKIPYPMPINLTLVLVPSMVGCCFVRAACEMQSKEAVIFALVFSIISVVSFNHVKAISSRKFTLINTFFFTTIVTTFVFPHLTKSKISYKTTRAMGIWSAILSLYFINLNMPQRKWKSFSYI